MYKSTFDYYIDHAYPHDELKPISCSGARTLGNYSLTLIDALDGLVMINDSTRFFQAVNLVAKVDFDLDINVSVFETNIRILGGLLSAYLVASEKYPTNSDQLQILRSKAIDIGKRLSKAFDTSTGIPYGTVNLRHGIPKGETPVVCVACATTFAMEFGWLSILTGDPKYYHQAKKAAKAVYAARATTGLFGSHINAETSQFAYFESGVGGGIDSMYEYLIKAWVMFGDDEYASMAEEALHSVYRHVRHPSGWMLETDIGGSFNGRIASLAAFWPGTLTLTGDVYSSVRQIDLYSRLLSRNFHFLPEFYDLSSMSFVHDRKQYPLRPEFIESLWYVYRTTGSSSYLDIATEMLNRIEKHCKTKCGYADIKDVETLEKSDSMQSFFLSETLKYFFMIFGPSDFDNIRWMMTTEAHFLPITSETIKLGSVSTPVKQKCKQLTVNKNKRQFVFHKIYAQQIGERRRIRREMYSKCHFRDDPKRSFPLDCDVRELNIDLSNIGTCSYVIWVMAKEYYFVE